MAAGGIMDVPETVQGALPESETQPQTVPETQPQTEPEAEPQTQVPTETEGVVDYEQQLQDIQAELDDLQTLLADKLDLIDGKLIEPVTVGEQLCYPYCLVTDPDAVPETAAPEPVAAETAAAVDYSEDIQALLIAIEDVNTHLETVQLYQANQQNLQVPALCGLALIFGGILALICSNYIRH